MYCLFYFKNHVIFYFLIQKINQQYVLKNFRFELVETVVSNHRPHIHIICDSKDATLHPLLDAITVCFESCAYLTYDLFITGSDSASYSWQCINKCQFVFILIGKNYGELSNTGVSQLHVSYLNAKTKNRPLIAFITDETERPRQLTDLITLVESQAQTIHQINPTTHLKLLLEKVKPTITPCKNGFDNLNLQNSKTTPNLAPSSLNYESLIPKKIAPRPQDEVLLNCNAHAFRGGTLIEVAFLANVTWQMILASLDSSLAFTSQGLWRMLNDLVTPQAMPAIKVNNPMVHAISRCQIAKADMLWVEEELAESGWIVPAPISTPTKPTWRMSDSAKKILGI